MQSSTIKFNASIIHYISFGYGHKVIVCFHGYGETCESFAFLSKYLNPELFTLIAIDLPFHGKTEWNEGLNLSPSTLLQITQQILLQTKSFQKEHKISLMGYSLGGRIALSLLQLMPDEVEKLILLAPDGLKVNFWYWLSTQTILGNKFFAYTMKHPKWFFFFLKLLNKLKLVNASIFKFVDYYIGDKEVRKLLYQRWTTLRKLKPNLPHIKSIITNKNIPVKLIYGKHDRIILSSVGESFRTGIENQCTIAVIHAGHQVLHEKHIKELLPAILY